MRLIVALAIAFQCLLYPIVCVNAGRWVKVHSHTDCSGESRLSRRATACDTIAGTTYTWNNSTFSLSCNTTYDHWDVIFLTYTPSFSSCMESCVLFDSSTPCLGVDYFEGDYGPDGARGGSRCYGLWNLSNGSYSGSEDSAQLQNWVPQSVVFFFIFFYNLSIV